jgi:predicted mannosyl-3-phosphoglycerate phosphatase (HAD superfamily)
MQQPFGALGFNTQVQLVCYTNCTVTTQQKQSKMVSFFEHIELQRRVTVLESQVKKLLEQMAAMQKDNATKTAEQTRVSGWAQL